MHKLNEKEERDNFLQRCGLVFKMNIESSKNYIKDVETQFILCLSRETLFGGGRLLRDADLKPIESNLR